MKKGTVARKRFHTISFVPVCLFDTLEKREGACTRKNSDTFLFEILKKQI